MASSEESRQTVELVVSGPLDAAAVAAWSERLGLLLQNHVAELVVCDVGALEHVDAQTVDALARLQLVARRHGSSIRLRRASTELQDLLQWSGLSEVLPGGAGLPDGLRGHSEQ